jgi:hypothetical protein
VSRLPDHQIRASGNSGALGVSKPESHKSVSNPAFRLRTVCIKYSRDNDRKELNLFKRNHLFRRNFSFSEDWRDGIHY